MKWPCNKEQHAHMAERKRQNRARIVKAENWAYEYLKKLTRVKWTRQAQWGFRIFDFWSHELGCAVEIDGSTHDAAYDAKRDSRNWKVSKVIVLRVKNYNENEMLEAIKTINGMSTWKSRRSE